MVTITFDLENSNVKDGQGQTHWSHLTPGVQSICLLFVTWQSDHFWLRYRKFHISTICFLIYCYKTFILNIMPSKLILKLKSIVLIVYKLWFHSNGIRRKIPSPLIPPTFNLINSLCPITHWGQDKMAAIFQTNEITYPFPNITGSTIEVLWMEK